MSELKPTVNADPEASGDDRLEEQAIAEYHAGRVVPHAEVAAWLNTWGTGKRLPCPGPKGH